MLVQTKLQSSVLFLRPKDRTRLFEEVAKFISVNMQALIDNDQLATKQHDTDKPCRVNFAVEIVEA